MNWRYILIHSLVGVGLGVLLILWVYFFKPPDTSLGIGLLLFVIAWAVLPPRIATGFRLGRKKRQVGGRRLAGEELGIRIPLVRMKGDDRPTAWWEVLFVPVMVPVFILFLIVAAVASIPMEWAVRRRMNREEEELRSRLSAQGRSMAWDEVAAELEEGRGTLIVEHRSPKGPIREWWTKADLLLEAPAKLPSSLLEGMESEELRELVCRYAVTCAARFIDVEKGEAMITEVPVPPKVLADPRKYVVVNLGGGWQGAILLVKGRELAKKYPLAKVVTLLAWSEKKMLARGDAEDVFLGKRVGDGG